MVLSYFSLLQLYDNNKERLSLQHFPRARVVVVHATNSSVGGRESSSSSRGRFFFYSSPVDSIKSVYC